MTERLATGRWALARVLLLCALLYALDPSAYGQDAPSSQQLESGAVRIGAIRILIGDVFATETPEENKRFYRLANKLHIETREAVIRRQLVIKEGDVYSERLVRESERILRRNSYLFDAKIVPVTVQERIVDLEVRTRDVWTFKPTIQYERSGGEDSTGFALQESNLLGYGKEVTVAHQKNVDRTSNEFRYFDPQLFGSLNRMSLSYSNNSDGTRSSGFVDRPFHALDTRWAASASALDWERTDQRYELGRVVDEFRHDQQTAQLSGGYSRGLQDGWVGRYSFGAAYAHDRFAPTTSILSATVLPNDRKFVYPFIGYSLFENRFEERRNENQIERTEDLFSGKYFQATLGWADETFSSSVDAAIISLGAGDTFEGRDRRHTMILQSSASTRLEERQWRNASITGAARYYWRVAERQLFFASLSGTATHELDADKQLTLGGDSGLRGYPLRYQDGSASALLTVEHRVYTKYYLFRIFHVGGAVFADAGRTWGRGRENESTNVDTNLGLLKNVGLGLRFGSSRSAFGNVIHVDLAFPLDGDDSIDRMQFLVESKASF